MINILFVSVDLRITQRVYHISQWIGQFTEGGNNTHTIFNSPNIGQHSNQNQFAV